MAKILLNHCCNFLIKNLTVRFVLFRSLRMGTTTKAEEEEDTGEGEGSSTTTVVAPSITLLHLRITIVAVEATAEAERVPHKRMMGERDV